MLKVQGIVTKRCQTWKKLIPTVKIWGKKTWIEWKEHVVLRQNKTATSWTDNEATAKKKGKLSSVITTCLYEPWNITQNALFFFLLWANQIQAACHYFCFSIAYRLYECSFALELRLIQRPYSQLDWAGNSCTKDSSPHQCQFQPAFHSTFTHSHVLI